MASNKITRSNAAQAASAVLKGKSTGTNSKSAAGSALSQTNSPKKVTSKSAATAASAVLRDNRTSAASKSAAGSALSQRKNNLS
jgi:hypothetical protein